MATLPDPIGIRYKTRCPDLDTQSICVILFWSVFLDIACLWGTQGDSGRRFRTFVEAILSPRKAMPRTPSFAVIETPKGWMVSVPPAMSASGKRVRKYHKTKTKAEEQAKSLRAYYQKGHRAGLISATLAMEAARAMEILGGTGISLLEAARMAKAQAGNEADKETLQARYDRMVTSNEMRWSKRYVLEMERMPRWMPADFWKRSCAGIDRAAIEAALAHRGALSRSTLDLRSRMVLAVINYRDRHRKEAKIDILTRDQQKALFAACATPDELRVVGLLLYAGIRPDSAYGEISRMGWESVSGGQIHVQRGKVGGDRLIPVCPVLEVILKDRPKSGPVCPAKWGQAWTRIRKEAGISHLKDVLRHTFASHYLMWKNEDECKSVLGHTANSTTLFRHYRKAVTKADAVEFFEESIISRVRDDC